MSNCYRVLRGVHSEGMDGRRPLMYGPGQPDGDVVESKSNLLKLNPRAGAPKFEKLHPDEVAGLQAEQEDEGDGLDDLTLDQLRQIAETEEPPIDLAGATRKRDIIARIRTAGAPASA